MSESERTKRMKYFLKQKFNRNDSDYKLQLQEEVSCGEYLLGFRILSSNFGVLIFLLSISLVFSVLGTVANFIDIYKVGKYEDPEEIEKN